MDEVVCAEVSPPTSRAFVDFVLVDVMILDCGLFVDHLVVNND